jgi:hypothetical protein
MSYITANDIKSNLVRSFDISDYLEEAENEINDVAQRLGIYDTDDISTPIHYKIKRYGIVYVLMRLAQDKIGTCDDDVTLERYQVSYDMYKAEMKDLYPQLTYQMFTGNVTSIISRTSSCRLYRG